MIKDEAGNELEVPLVTSRQILARTRERKAKSTLLMAIIDEHLARFHVIKDAKTLWATIKTRFGGNDESKKMQKNVLNQQFEIFYVSNLKGLDKGSLPSAWSNISLIMRNKPGIDNLDIDDLYNNLKVYKANIKGSSRSSSNSQNVAFVSVESTSSTNELNATYSVSTATGHSSQAQGSSSYDDELMLLFFANQSSNPYLDKDELEQIDQDDLKEIDLKWQVVMLSMRGKSARNTGNISRDAGNARYIGRDNGKRPAKEEDEQALVVQDGLGTYDWSYQVKEEATDFALMAFTLNPSSSSSLNSKHEKHGKANIEIIVYQYSLESIERQVRVHQQNEVIYEEKIGVLEYQGKDERYDSQFNEKEVLDIKEEEVTETVFDNRLSNEENSVANDRFKKGKGYHAVPPLLTGNYMPPKPDLSFAGLDDFIYKFKISEIVTSLAKDEKDAPETSTAYVEKPKEDRSSAPLIEDWETDSDDDIVFTPEPIPAKIDFVKADRMAKQFVLPTNVGKGIGHRESRPVWNNVQRINHQNKFAPTSVFTRSGRIPNVVPSEDLTCLFAKASIDVSNLWHKRLGHVTFESMNKLMKGNLVSGLPLKMFNNDHSCVACQKGKQHKATCKAKLDETSKVLKPFITAIENQINKKVKVIRCDNETKFKNKDLDEFCGMKGIKREYSNAKTPQQNKATEQKNRTLIEAARTMLADSLLPVTFWAEAVNTACYVLNRALVTKTHNKTPYELLNDRSPRLDFMRTFSCRVTILNTLDPLGKFKGKADKGFLVGYSITSKAFRKSSDDKPADDKPKDDIGSKTVEDRSIRKIKLTEMNLIG
nr:hypothetical protein [Tanacetum cinerariifolium]